MNHEDIKLLCDQLNNTCDPLLECDYLLFGQVVDALEAQAKEIENLRTLWKIAQAERSEAMLELLKYKSLCDQMGEALERCAKHVDVDYSLLSAWRAVK